MIREDEDDDDVEVEEEENLVFKEPETITELSEGDNGMKRHVTKRKRMDIEQHIEKKRRKGPLEVIEIDEL